MTPLTRTLTTSSRTTRTAAAAGALALSLTACGGSSDSAAAPAAPAAQTTSTAPSAAAEQTATDAAFVANMLPHHKGGIELGKLAATKGVDPRVKKLGTAIAAKQTEELALLEGLAQRLGSTPAMPPEIEARDMRDMAALQALSGPAFDAMWLEVISGHHSSAVQMASIERDGGQDDETTSLAAEIVTTQLRELGEFNTIIADLKKS